MITNNTTSILHHHHHHQIESIDEPTAINQLAPKYYDPAGAALFIIVVVLWYSIGTVCMLGMQIRARSERIEDCVSRRAKLFIQNLRDQTQTKQILEELVDKKKRDKLWDIYLGKTNNNTEKLKRAEILRIKNIEKQLAVINRNRVIMNDTLISPIVRQGIRRTSSDCRSISTQNNSIIENRSRTRRRTSLDQQIIERWKSVVGQTKAHEQLPWTIRKIVISRHFRRNCKNSLQDFQEIKTPLSDSPPTNEHLQSIDDELCHLLPLHKQVSINSTQIRRQSSDRLNPYVTYFHLPINENSKSDNQNFPLVTITSDHHIIPMNRDESQC